ncbi:unnamed protein product, partial [Didymodactylos carnosus]
YLTGIIDGYRLEQSLSNLKNLSELNFFFRSYSTTTTVLTSTIISSFKTYSWMTMLKATSSIIVCHQDSYLYNYYLYTIPYAFDNNCDFLSYDVINYCCTKHDNESRQPFQTLEAITPNGFCLNSTLSYSKLRLINEKYLYLKCLNIYGKFQLTDDHNDDDVNIIPVFKHCSTITFYYIKFFTEKSFDDIIALFLMTPNVKIINIDNFSLCNIFSSPNIDKITHKSLYQHYFNHISELNIIEIHENNYNNLSIFLKHFSNIKILRLSFINKLKSNIIIYDCIVPIIRSLSLTLHCLKCRFWNDDILDENGKIYLKRILDDIYENINYFLNCENGCIDIWM